MNGLEMTEIVPVDYDRMTIYNTPADKQRADHWRQYT